MTAEERTQYLANRLRGVVSAWADDRIDPEVTRTDDGNPDFQASCDDYQAFCFTAEINGRTYHFTVEDVTLAEGE